MRLMSLITAGALALAFSFAAAASLAAERAIIILDGSGSMWAQIDGEARISIAREALADVLDSVPDELELGFMSYGHRQEGDCSDIELMVPPAAGTADQIRAAAKGIKPLGKTPLSAAVQLAAEDLQYLEEKATVILITDGIESCEADPCALASELEQQGVDFTTHVVGFGLSDEEGRQVACLAENTGGTYYQASDGKALGEALRTVTQVAAAPEPQPEPAPEPPAALDYNFAPELVMAEGGEHVTKDQVTPTWEVYKAAAGGERGERVTTDYGIGWRTTLEPGDYIVAARVDFAETEQPVTIANGEAATPLFNLNATYLTVRPMLPGATEPDGDARVELTLANGNTTTNYGTTSYWVPAGEVGLKARMGRAEAAATFTVAAGEKVTRDILIDVGRIVLNAAYVEGMPVEDGDLTFNVVGAKKDIQGNRQDFGTEYGPDTAFDLPPGDYVALVRMGETRVELPFTIVAGERLDANAVLEAGVLVIAAPAYDFVEIFSTKKDIQGNREAFGYGWGGALQTTLPAGDYVVVAHPKGDDGAAVEVETHVTAGERTELNVE